VLLLYLSCLFWGRVQYELAAILNFQAHTHRQKDWLVGFVFLGKTSSERRAV